MDIGIVTPVIVLNGLNHCQRLLRGGCVIQINQRPAVDGLMQNGEIFTDLLHVVGGCSLDFMRYFGHSAHPTSSQLRSATSPDRGPANVAASGIPATTNFSRCSRICGEFIRSRHSLANASNSTWRAAASARPRERR